MGWKDPSNATSMKSAEDTTQTACSSREDTTLQISRRDVLLTGAAGTGLLATTGASSAAPDEESGDSRFTITVTGLEIDGPLEECVVEYGDEQKTTDESGNVAFDVSDDPQEVVLEKEGWEDKTETIGPDETDQEVYIPMYVTGTISG